MATFEHPGVTASEGGGLSSAAVHTPEIDQAAANACEHFYMWSSPAGSRHSARLCMGCHSPDPEWLNELHERETKVIRNVFLTLVETSDEIEGGQIPGAGWLHTQRAVNQWLRDRREWELTEGVALREEARNG